MAQRRFGVTRALGIAVEEKQGGVPMTPAQLGTVLLMGETDRGDEANIIQLISSRKTAWRLLGGHREGSYLMDAIDGFFAENHGGGRLYVAGIPPQNGGKASLYLGPRKLGEPIAKIEAKSNGKWAGQADTLYGDLPTGADIANTTMKVATGQPGDKWAGATLIVPDVPTKTYKVISNTTDTLTLAPGSTLVDDLAAAGGSIGTYLLEQTNSGQHLAVKVEPGKLNPSHFALTVYIDGETVKTWDDLTMDQSAANYAQDVINSDPDNHEIVFTDLRAAGSQTTVDDELSNRIVRIDSITAAGEIVIDWWVPQYDTGIFGTTITPPTGYHPVACDISIVVDGTDPALFAWSALGLSGSGAFGTEVDPGVNYLPKFTVTDATLAATAGQELTISLLPLPDMTGSVIYPGYKTSDPYDVTSFVVKSNTYSTIEVTYGDPTNGGAVGTGDLLMLSYPQQCAGGYDGEAMSASDQAAMWSQIGDLLKNDPEFKDAGLIKMAAPGWNNSAVQKTGIAVAESLSYQYRVEAPADQTTGGAMLKWLDAYIGRSEFAIVNWPSYGYILDPEKPGIKKLIPLTGDILGVEAAVAKNYLGYHKPAAGIDAVLHRIIDLAISGVPNEELISPTGVNLLKKYRGNVIIWGFRTLSPTAEWQWKNQREQMSYYERLLLSQFNWLIAMLNDKATWGLLHASLSDYFRGEYRKGALVGNTFKDACIIKIDEENNPTSAQVNGDLYADISLALPMAIERVTFRVGKAGVTEL